ncbi:ABC transporter, ATP-binding domain containing protein, putative [Babesia bigemina]|uniref:ABC transporter, ATP-binding domain containing protein, putative n=1 Tax=Babesia bigemina TaxID=5866 RepID=A0A061D670_BABBI|nr:ABC transporter, ATP-binding domain containing protein, putative [Babesia bigemina]CDR96191.1 ABC transporter, ATP-binding domain containing protein, putative [Babesia bigemina]|eukprot:XP_012768377.1 ABC transporter, ATP-binding domain containing protein, putative [Babesia bigemina]
MLKEWPFVVPTFVALLASSAFITVFPSVVGTYINSFSTESAPSMVQGSFFVMGAAIASFMKCLLSGLASLRMARRMREDLYASMLGRDVSFFDKNSSGKLSSVISTDTAVAAGIIDHLCQMVRASASFVVGTYFSLKLAPVSLMAQTMLPIVALMFIILPLSRCVQRQTAVQMRRLAALISHTEERFSHMKTVKAFNAEPIEQTVFAEKMRHLFTASVKAALYNASMNFVAVGAVGSLIILTVNKSASLILDGTMQIGDVTSLLMYTALVGGSLQSCTSSFAEIRKCIGAAVTLASHMDGNNVKTTSKHSLTSVPPEIEFKNVYFSYPLRPDCAILRNLSFVLPSGKTLVIFGESGCGKSSIIQVLLGLYAPNAGSVCIDGVPLSDINIKELRSLCGWVEQQGALFNETIRNNVLYGNVHETVDLQDSYKRSGLMEVLNSMPDGDKTMVGQMGKGLSGGQRQRVSIARTLARDPKLVLLDEVTSALDVESEQQLNRNLAEFLREKTAIVITHRPTLLSLADYVMVMHEGKVSQFGTKSDVVAAPCDQLSRLLHPCDN